jgi:hypothetical protein
VFVASKNLTMLSSPQQKKKKKKKKKKKIIFFFQKPCVGVARQDQVQLAQVPFGGALHQQGHRCAGESIHCKNKKSGFFFVPRRNDFFFFFFFFFFFSTHIQKINKIFRSRIRRLAVTSSLRRRTATSFRAMVCTSV